MVYIIRQMYMDNEGELYPAKKHTEKYISDQELKVGGLYFLRPGRLYRVEEKHGKG